MYAVNLDDHLTLQEYIDINKKFYIVKRNAKFLSTITSVQNIYEENNVNTDECVKNSLFLLQVKFTIS